MALSEFIHHLEIMKKAQEKLDKVVVGNRLVLESDLHNLPYLHAIVKENFHYTFHFPFDCLMLIVKILKF